MTPKEAENRAGELMEADAAIKQMSRVANALWGLSNQFSNAGSYSGTVEKLNRLRVEFRNAFLAAEQQLQEEVARELPAIHAAHASRHKTARKVSR